MNHYSVSNLVILTANAPTSPMAPHWMATFLHGESLPRSFVRFSMMRSIAELANAIRLKNKFRN